MSHTHTGLILTVQWWALVVCAPVQDACSFNGAWRGKPSSMARVYYVSSYFWDRAQDSGIISDKAAISWKTSPGVSDSVSTATSCICA